VHPRPGDATRGHPLLDDADDRLVLVDASPAGVRTRRVISRMIESMTSAAGTPLPVT
jgi:hypothetical protein